MIEVIAGAALAVIGGILGAVFAEFLHRHRTEEARRHDAMSRALDDTGRFLTDGLQALVPFALDRATRFSNLVTHIDSRGYEYADPTLLGNADLLTEIADLFEACQKAGRGNCEGDLDRIVAAIEDVQQALLGQKRHLAQRQDLRQADPETTKRLEGAARRVRQNWLLVSRWA